MIAIQERNKQRNMGGNIYKFFCDILDELFCCDQISGLDWRNISWLEQLVYVAKVRYFGFAFPTVIHFQATVTGYFANKVMITLQPC